MLLLGGALSLAGLFVATQNTQSRLAGPMIVVGATLLALKLLG